MTTEPVIIQNRVAALSVAKSTPNGCETQIGAAYHAMLERMK